MRYWKKLTPYHLPHRLQQTNGHDNATENDTHVRSVRLPGPPLRQFDIAKRRENISQRARARSADELEHDADVACNEGERHGGYDEGSGEDQMAVWVVRLAGEVVFCHDLATDEAFQRESCDHVEAETETGDVDHDVFGWEVVQDVAFRHVAEGDVAA